MARPFVIASVICVCLGIAVPGSATTVAGTEGPEFGAPVVSKGLEATGQKPESKLFYTEDGRWFAVLGVASAVVDTPGVYVFELDGAGWEPRLRLADSDPWSKADTLYDVSTSTLLVSLRDNKATLGDNPRRSTLHELTYQGGGEWSETVVPTTITTANVETITIARDSVGRIWTAFEQGKRVKAGYLNGSSFTYLPVSVTNVAADDIAAVVAFDGQIGVLWSDQITDTFIFAVRSDTATLRKTSFAGEVVYGGGVGGCPTATSDLCSDDHINVAVVGTSVVAAVKTSLNDPAGAAGDDPLIVFLQRGGSGWSATEVADVASNLTRPIVLADPEGDAVHVFTSGFGSGGDTYVSHSSLSSPSFGAPEPWTVDDTLTLQNPTSTKQHVSAATGYVVMTSTVKSPYRYWYNLVPGV